MNNAQIRSHIHTAATALADAKATENDVLVSLAHKLLRDTLNSLLPDEPAKMRLEDLTPKKP